HGNGNGNGQGNGHGNGQANGNARLGLGRRPDVQYVSPLRGGRIPEAGPLELAPSGVATAMRPASAEVADLPPIAPPEPVLTHEDSDPDAAAPERDLEPALPDEARDRAALAAASPTIPLDASGSAQILHVRFTRGPSDRLVPAMEALRQVIRDRPGETQVIVYVHGPGGAILPMPLRTSVAY